MRAALKFSAIVEPPCEFEHLPESPGEDAEEIALVGLVTWMHNYSDRSRATVRMIADETIDLAGSVLVSDCSWVEIDDNVGRASWASLLELAVALSVEFDSQLFEHACSLVAERSESDAQALRTFGALIGKLDDAIIEATE